MTEVQAKRLIAAIASAVLIAGIALWDQTGQTFLIWSGLSGFAYLAVWHFNVRL